MTTAKIVWLIFDKWRLTFGKDANRLQLVFLADSGSIDRSYITAEHPALLVVDPENTGAQLRCAGKIRCRRPVSRRPARQCEFSSTRQICPLQMCVKILRNCLSCRKSVNY